MKHPLKSRLNLFSKDKKRSNAVMFKKMINGNSAPNGISVGDFVASDHYRRSQLEEVKLQGGEGAR